MQNQQIKSHNLEPSYDQFIVLKNQRKAERARRRKALRIHKQNQIRKSKEILKMRKFSQQSNLD